MLAERYGGVAMLPWVAICDLPTVLEPLRVDAEVGSLYTKRDDLTSAAYGGNKARKLELLLGGALAEGRKAVVTFGAYGSNHALATAVHAFALGLEPHVVLSPQPPGPFVARTLRAHAWLGTAIHPIAGWDGRREAVRVLRELTVRDTIEPAVIPMGGTNALGAVAYVNAAFELLEDAGAGHPPNRVYVAAGTLGTAIGLAIGFAAAGAPTRVEAVRVTPTEICNVEIARELCDRTIELLSGLAPSFPTLHFEDLPFTLREEYAGPGYGVATPETVRAVSAARDAGIALETTYTGKAFAALLDDARAGRLAGERVVFWNTYSSAPLPPRGRDQALPDVVRVYVEECDRLYPATVEAFEEGATP